MPGVPNEGRPSPPFFRLRREVIVAQELMVERLKALEAAARSAGVPVLAIDSSG
jgi:hypothetical protein